VLEQALRIPQFIADVCVIQNYGGGAAIFVDTAGRGVGRFKKTVIGKYEALTADLVKIS
jgi:hypothetical protein